ncbi:hypothetical protein PYW08_009890 [Mythimna loreyi]|uniref:Uncharacterized protein n=1 Tax=Mythimna loreyi TaxID=667449 RepID=A0ACC2Q9N4_9NEOP|nr:hypothetical protein PYW08_009890 [Mythimna loreyi]
MKNVSSLKSNATNSPKTPGGISKSLLTPCRRLGLSRNWKNKGPSPFISPLAGSTQEVKEEKSEPRKRKQRVLEDNVESTPTTSTVDKNEIDEDQSNDTDKTPSRNIELPRRKKSKTLLETINKSQEDIDVHSVTNSNDDKIAISADVSERADNENTTNTEVVSTPVRTKSKKNKKKSPRVKSDSKSTEINSNPKPEVYKDENTDDTNKNSKESPETVYEIKEKSPNDLKKECVVVIQRKIFKKTEDSEKEDKSKLKKNKKEKSSSQALFDSDSDETPLIELNKKESSISKAEKKTEETKGSNKTENRTDHVEDDDFIDQSTKIQAKVKDTKSPKNKLKTNKVTKLKVEKPKVQPKPPSQSSFDDDDDFDDNKKTILIRKTYEKVSKPLKAKSTGSITQKDIDELKARIEAKKKLLLAQSLNPDTEELRNLIKKWQKGCQNALIELLDLMKAKFNDKQDMDYSEMLKSLKIPPSLVGYDAENDCFNEPNDANIILGQFADII